MYINMHCMGMPFNGTTINEKSLGGSETAAYYMARELAKLGHRVRMFTNSPDEGEFENVNYLYAGNVTKEAPLGERFHFFAENTPHDVCIIQRHPAAFAANIQAKIKLWWMHDLAQIRFAPDYTQHLWNTTGIMVVSEFHKKQVCEAWGVNPDKVFVVPNGIDLELFEGEICDKAMKVVNQAQHTRLLYSSRPERGLEHLIAPNGIMDQLKDKKADYHLYVCGYDNTTADMADYYGYLNHRIEKMHNVTNLGSLTKKELADVMRQMHIHVYPTPGPKQPNFEEVSCITAMECMAAGLPMVYSDSGALSETCADTGVRFIPLDKNGMPNVKDFAAEIDKVGSNQNLQDKLRKLQLQAKETKTWERSAKRLNDSVFVSLFSSGISAGAMARHMLRVSDIVALENSPSLDHSDIARNALAEYKECFGFHINDTFEEHYKAYYEYEKERGANYGPENLNNNDRFEWVSSVVARIPAGHTVLDYGCAHGHYTINLAKRFPDKHFIGVDITLSNIEKARKWAEDDKLNNVEFFHGCVKDGRIKYFEHDATPPSTLSCIIAAEVVEHVSNPHALLEALHSELDYDGLMIVTVPYGPWEYIGAIEHWPWRAHLHHFERGDLQDMLGHYNGYQIVCAPSGQHEGMAIGSYGVLYEPSKEPCGEIDYSRKHMQSKPRQTLSLCMIAKDAESDIKRCLDSVRGIVDEIIIGLDSGTTDRTRHEIMNWATDNNHWPVVKVIDINPAIETGFDAARNATLKDASGDWVMWLDTDEVLVHGENLLKYLQDNHLNGYCVKQNHFSTEPAGVIKTDLPMRLFRNRLDVKFFGVVHEHPEVTLNNGVKHLMVIPDIEIAHYGYTTENVRAGRFNRNINLMKRDREENPTRILGKFLWIRDLSLIIKRDLEATGGYINDDMRAMAKEGIDLWVELVKDGQLRFAFEGLEFYDLLVEITGKGLYFNTKLSVSKLQQGGLEQKQPIASKFYSKEHFTMLMDKLIDNTSKDFESKYY